MFVMEMNTLLGPIKSRSQVSTQLAFQVTRNGFLGFCHAFDFESVGIGWIFRVFIGEMGFQIVNGADHIFAVITDKLGHSFAISRCQIQENLESQENVTQKYNKI